MRKGLDASAGDRKAQGSTRLIQILWAHYFRTLVMILMYVNSLSFYSPKVYFFSVVKVLRM